LIKLLLYVFGALHFVWVPFIWFSSISSIAIGCFGAFVQKKLKRFLAFTSINQMGFLLIGLCLNNW
jgi:NADH-quinone oxidoreductase subunit N